jgi:hypothetical protein
MSAKSAISARSPPLICCRFRRRIISPCLSGGERKARAEDVRTKRTKRTKSAPSILQRRYHLASGGLGPVSSGCDVSKLSKLRNQEDALGAPCFCSPQARPRGVQECCGKA